MSTKAAENYYLTCECGCRKRLISGRDYDLLAKGDPLKQALVYRYHVYRMIVRGWYPLVTLRTAVLMERAGK